MLLRVFVYLSVFLFACSADRGEIYSDGSRKSQAVIQVQEEEGPPEVPSAVNIVSAVGKCLEMNLNDFERKPEASELRSWDCVVGAAQQLWHLDLDKIRSANGQCLSAGEFFGQWPSVIAERCKDKIGQRWIYNASISAFYNGEYPERCLNIFNDQIHRNGRQIILSVCRGSENEIWSTDILETVTIESYDFPGRYLIATDVGYLISFTDENTSLGTEFLWSIEPSGSTFRLRSQHRPEFHLDNEGGEISIRQIEPFGLSSKWNLIETPELGEGVYQIQNILNESVFLNALPDTGFSGTQEGIGSTYWRVNSVSKL